MDCNSPWNSPGQNNGVGSLSLLQRDLPNPGIEPRSPILQADSRVGILSLLQGILENQELIWALLNRRQIFYQPKTLSSTILLEKCFFHWIYHKEFTLQNPALPLVEGASHLQAGAQNLVQVGLHLILESQHQQGLVLVQGQLCFHFFLSREMPHSPLMHSTNPHHSDCNNSY